MSKGLITQSELEDALQYQKINREYLGKILIKRGVISEKQLLDALSEQFNIPVVSIKGKQIDVELASLFSKSLILDHQCFPIAKNADTVIMAVSNPLDAWIVSQAEQEVKDYRVERVLIPQGEMDELLDKYRQYIKDKIKKLFGDKKKPF